MATVISPRAYPTESGDWVVDPDDPLTLYALGQRSMRTPAQITTRPDGTARLTGPSATYLGPPVVRRKVTPGVFNDVLNK